MAQRAGEHALGDLTHARTLAHRRALDEREGLALLQAELIDEHSLGTIDDLARLQLFAQRVDLAGELLQFAETADGLRIEPRPLRPATLATYDDHRMAMSLALAGLRVPGLRVADPGCVGKTFPDYWERLDAITAARP